MPELPEVETIRLGMSRLLPGRTVSAVAHDTPKSFPNAATDVQAYLVGSHIDAVRRRAKVLIIDLSSGYSLVIHLKMTGQLVFRHGAERFGAGHPSDSLVGNLPDKSTRVVITFDDGAQLFFNDQRKFGWMRLLPTPEAANIDFMQKVGPEPLEADFTWQVLRDRLQRRKNTTIKAALLDQTVIAGVGNIYADESLWGAKIHPTALVRSLRDEDFKRLHIALVAVLRLSIEKGGSTDKNYVNAEGNKGSYLSFANVFRREGQPCPRHPDTQIIKLRVASRGTHICPKCQRLADYTSNCFDSRYDKRMAKQAFVIPRAELVGAGIIPEETQGKAMYVPIKTPEDLDELLSLAAEHGEYRERGGDNDVEKDSSVQQLIVYGYVELKDGRFMLYQRGSQEDSESRLHGKVSLGLGGHREPTDLSLMDAFYRELDEETIITANDEAINFRRQDGSTDVALMQQYVQVQPRGVIKDERDEVGTVHVGIACRLTPIRDDVAIEVRAETGENVRSFYVTPEEYSAMVSSGEIDPEGWTDIVFRHELQRTA